MDDPGFGVDPPERVVEAVREQQVSVRQDGQIVHAAECCRDCWPSIPGIALGARASDDPQNSAGVHLQNAVPMLHFCDHHLPGRSKFDIEWLVQGALLRRSILLG